MNALPFPRDVRSWEKVTQKQTVSRSLRRHLASWTACGKQEQGGKRHLPLPARWPHSGPWKDLRRLIMPPLSVRPGVGRRLPGFHARKIYRLRQTCQGSCAHGRLPGICDCTARPLTPPPHQALWVWGRRGLHGLLRYSE